MNELERLRSEIDEIDRGLIDLFESRLEKVLKIGEFKKKTDLPIVNQARELEVLEKNISRLKNKNFENETKEFLNKVIELSRDLQIKKLNTYEKD